MIENDSSRTFLVTCFLFHFFIFNLLILIHRGFCLSFYFSLTGSLLNVSELSPTPWFVSSLTFRSSHTLVVALSFRLFLAWSFSRGLAQLLMPVLGEMPSFSSNDPMAPLFLSYPMPPPPPPPPTTLSRYRELAHVRFSSFTSLSELSLYSLCVLPLFLYLRFLDYLSLFRSLPLWLRVYCSFLGTFYHLLRPSVFEVANCKLWLVDLTTTSGLTDRIFLPWWCNYKEEILRFLLLKKLIGWILFCNARKIHGLKGLHNTYSG